MAFLVVCLTLHKRGTDLKPSKWPIVREVGLGFGLQPEFSQFS